MGMKNFNYKLMYGFVHHNLVWIRFGYFDWGIELTCKSKLFSERYGHKRYLPLPFRWRITILKAKGV